MLYSLIFIYLRLFERAPTVSSLVNREASEFYIYNQIVSSQRMYVN